MSRYKISYPEAASKGFSVADIEDYAGPDADGKIARVLSECFGKNAIPNPGPDQKFMTFETDAEPELILKVASAIYDMESGSGVIEKLEP